MTLTGYQFRAPTPEDRDAIGAVLVADDIDETGETILDALFVQAQWNRAGFDLARDACVVIGDSGVVGYGQAYGGEPDVVGCWGVVDPDHRGRGIGAALLDRIERRATELATQHSAARIRHSITTRDRAAANMLRVRGFRPVRYFHHMRIDLSEPIERVVTPDGVEITGVRVPRDLHAVHEVLTGAFTDEWSFEPQPFDRWAEEQLNRPTLDTTLWLLAFARHEPVGVVTATVWGNHGWVDELGVLAAHRGRGIGLELLRGVRAPRHRTGHPECRRRERQRRPSAVPAGGDACHERLGGVGAILGWVRVIQLGPA